MMAEHARAVLAADQVHLDAMAVAVIDRAVGEARQVEIAAELAIDALQHIEIEARGDAGGIVIGVVQRALVLSRSTPMIICAPSPRFCALRRKACASCGSKLPSVDRRSFGAATASGSANGAVKSAATG